MSTRIDTFTKSCRSGRRIRAHTWIGMLADTTIDRCRNTLKIRVQRCPLACLQAYLLTLTSCMDMYTSKNRLVETCQVKKISVAKCWLQRPAHRVFIMILHGFISYFRYVLSVMTCLVQHIRRHVSTVTRCVCYDVLSITFYLWHHRYIIFKDRTCEHPAFLIPAGPIQSKVCVGFSGSGFRNLRVLDASSKPGESGVSMEMAGQAQVWWLSRHLANLG